MCESCGCSDHHPSATTHTHGGLAAHSHGPHGRTVNMGVSVLQHNAEIAARNRARFTASGTFVLNVLSAPGSGKTMLLERTLLDCRERWRMGVIVGDLQTDNDARRLRRSGAPAVQITTGTACHLDAHMVAHAADELKADGMDLLFIENVGNLVCPALFDLGEHARVVLLSVTEGEDKPLKYPTIFADADLVLVTKSDLADAAGFAAHDALANIRAAAPRAEILTLSTRTGAGLKGWYDWIDRKKRTLDPA
jgi:hydrogenase nickel incorporation protein HypB